MTPGLNQLVPISSGHLNRFVTPFEAPEVETADLSKEAVTVKGRVVLVTTKKKPATLFITPSGTNRPALSLTLIPKAIPPRQVILTVEQSAGRSWGQPQAADWERSQPYEATLRKLLGKIAKGRIPNGYNLRKPKAGDGPVVCRGRQNSRLELETGQVLEGARMRVKVAVATNPTDRPIELRETGCYHKGVLAVAAWPSPLLEPGQRTEVYQVVRRDTGGGSGAKQQKRPSLLHPEAASPAGGQGK